MAEILVGAIASCSASIITHPIEVAKLRIQLQGELTPPPKSGEKRRFAGSSFSRWRKSAVQQTEPAGTSAAETAASEGAKKVRPIYRNVPQALYTVARFDGPLAIYRGLVPGLGYQLLGNGLRLGIFQIIEDFGFTLDENLEPSIRLSAISGAVAGAIAAFTASPLFLLKTHMQVHCATSSIAVGYQHGYKSARSALVHICRTQGIWNGLWRATSSNVLRISTGSALQMSTFIGMKTLLNTATEGRERYFFINTVLAAFISGLMSAPVIAAVDVLRARMYAQPSGHRGEGLYYKSLWDCIRKIKRTEGLRGFSKGAGGAFLYSVVTSSITLISWDELKGARRERRHARDYYIDFGYQ